MIYELARFWDDAEDFRATVHTEAEATRWFQEQVALQDSIGTPVHGYVLACQWPTYPAPTAALRPYKIHQF